MKKNLILALLALFFTLGTGKMTVSAQSGVLQQRISVSVEGGTLDDAVVQIEKQTSLMFLYKTQDIAPSHRVTLHARREPLSVVLDRLVEGTKLGWELSDNHIVLTQKSVDDQPRRVTGHVLDKNGVPIIGAGRPSVRVPGPTALSRWRFPLPPRRRCCRSATWDTTTRKFRSGAVRQWRSRCANPRLKWMLSS